MQAVQIGISLVLVSLIADSCNKPLNGAPALIGTEKFAEPDEHYVEIIGDHTLSVYDKVWETYIRATNRAVQKVEQSP